MAIATHTYSITVNPPAAGSLLAGDLTGTDLSGCSGAVSINGAAVTTGPGAGSHVAQRGSVDINFWNEVLELEVDGTASGGEGPWRFSLRNLADCGLAGGVSTRVFVGIEPGGTSACTVQVDGQTALSTNVANVPDRTRWRISHIGIAGTQEIVFEMAEWNGSSFDAYTEVARQGEVASGQTWTRALLEALNFACGQDDFGAGTPGTVVYTFL